MITIEQYVSADDELALSRKLAGQPYDDGDYTHELLSIAAGLRAVAAAIQESQTHRDERGLTVDVVLDDQLGADVGRIADALEAREGANS